MQITCKHCGDKFTADIEDVKLLENGYISEITPVCDDCAFYCDGNMIEEYESFSDADSGL